MYFFLKKYKNVHFPYELLRVYVAHEHIILEILQNYITSSKNWNLCKWIWKFEELSKIYLITSFLY